MQSAIPTIFGQLQAVLLTAPDGAQAIVTPYGAHLVSWRGVDGRERLFVSAHSARDGKAAIRGGVPVIFPQFAARGSGQRHGFARTATWQFGASGVDAGWAWAEFSLSQADLTPAQALAWPHDFALTLRFAVRANELTVTFTVQNSGSTPFPFAAALHTYFLIDDIKAARIDGVEREEVAIHDKFDRIYENTAPRLGLHAGNAVLTLRQSGFTDAVVWNPGAVDAAALADLGDDEYRRFICIEPALLQGPTLAPGQQWQGVYQVS